MRGGLRRFFVALVALALLSGTLERSALGFTPPDPCPLSGYTHSVAHKGHEHYGHRATDKQQEPAKYRGTKCFCYAMVGFNLIPEPSVSDIAQQTTPVSFSAIVKTYIGRPVILDPGIPRRIA